MTTAEQILKQYWGHERFRTPQAEIIESVLDRKDTLAILPTGGGKSVCFQVPTMLMEGVCLVVTPLIALMQDQVTQLKQRGIQAIAVHSGMSREEIDIAIDNCVYGKIKFLYLSPERLQTEIFQERIKKMNVCLIAVDEAHCISQWGYDFRPPYLKIALLREAKPDVPIIALTASATRQVKEDIIDKLAFRGPAIFQKSFARENISFAIRKTETKEKKLIEILRKVKGTAIVYVRSRKATQELAKTLTRQGFSSIFYHAGLNHQERSVRQVEWLSSKIRVMVATNAFGMGINKLDVRTVVHMDLPENLESYYQEAGRAGRDGKRSYAVIIYHDVDVLALQHKVQQSQPSLDYMKKVYQALCNYYQLALGSSEGESYEFDLEDFCKRFTLKSSAVYIALKKIQQEGIIQFSESFYRPSRVHLDVDKKRLYEFQIANARFDPLIKSLLRLYGAELFFDFVAISETYIAQALKTNESIIRIDLAKLHELQLLGYHPSSEKPQVTFILPRQDADYLPVDRERMERLRSLSLTKMEAIVNYVSQSHRCRMQVMQEYFDEITYDTCGKCDVCLDKKKKESLSIFSDYHDQIVYLLKQKNMTVEELEQAVSPSDHELFVEVVREMVDASEISYDAYWVLSIH
ncbi:MAG: RecQ family ATP-dependent DNA helicase [Bacteroidia bacterium]|nr:RecQ family ATP-dependent DNA helicase [Bacteroidia bacterium]